MNNKEIEIILIEDNLDDAELAVHSLRESNLTNKIIHLKDGDEALRFFFSNETFDGEKFTASPKIVFLDLKMPKVNGIEVLEKIKSHSNTKDIPVVILTSSNEDPDIKKCYSLGANSYVVKPIEFENFSKQVAELGLYWTVINTAVQ
jgi:two-component system response regulator